MIKLENKIGTTETGDPCWDFGWTNRLRPVNIIITKNLSDEMINTLLTEECMKTCILHLTITGWGSTYMEPNVPPVVQNLRQLIKLVDRGFNKDHIVARIDPIIPTDTGLAFLVSTLSGLSLTGLGIKRVRVSVLDMYPHVLGRFRANHAEIPYTSFQAPDDLMRKVDNTLSMFSDEFEFESCAEPKLTIPKKVGCVSQIDIDLINPEYQVTLGDISGKQRSSCMCPNNKINILPGIPGKCHHKCLYCYWKTNRS